MLEADSRSVTIHHSIEKVLAPYRKLYKEKATSTIQTALNEFFIMK